MAKAKFEKEDYASVIDELSQIITDPADVEKEDIDLYETFMLLFKSYRETKDVENAWTCQLRALRWLVTKLIGYANHQMQTNILKKDQDTEFFKYLKRVYFISSRLAKMLIIN